MLLDVGRETDFLQVHNFPINCVVWYQLWEKCETTSGSASLTSNSLEVKSIKRTLSPSATWFVQYYIVLSRKPTFDIILIYTLLHSSSVNVWAPTNMVPSSLYIYKDVFLNILNPALIASKFTNSLLLLYLCCCVSAYYCHLWISGTVWHQWGTVCHDTNKTTLQKLLHRFTRHLKLGETPS